jgi:hypothetical protein
MGGRAIPPSPELLKKLKRHLHEAGVYGHLEVEENAAPAPVAAKPAAAGEAPAAAGPVTMIMYKDNETGQKIRVSWENDLKAVAQKIIKARK